MSDSGDVWKREARCWPEPAEHTGQHPWCPEKPGMPDTAGMHRKLLLSAMVDVRLEKVMRLRAAIAEGTYNVPAVDLARKLMGETLSDIGSVQPLATFAGSKLV